MRLFLFSLCAAISCCAPVLAQTPAQTLPTATVPLPLQAYSAVGGPKITVQNAVYRVENSTPGSFGVLWKLGQTDASKIARFSFEWKPSSDVKVNFFFKVAGKYYAVLLSGNSAVRAGTTTLGRATVTNLPDGFQRVEIPLRAWLLGLNPNANSLPVEEVLLGNWSNEGYLLAGVGGNGAGANYQVRAITIHDVSETKSAPEVKAPVLRNDEISWPISDYAGIETSALRFRAGEQTFDLNSPFLRLESKVAGDNLIQTVWFDAGDAGLTLADGQSLPLRLEGIKGATGRFANGTTDGVVANSVRFVASDFKENPPLPRLNISGLSYQNEGDFETSKNGFVAGSSVLERLAAPDRTGFALKLTNPKTAARFDTGIAAKVDVAQFPVLTFDYRCDDRVRLNFRFRWDNAEYSLRFLDRDNPPKEAKVASIGAIANLKADNTWATASFNFLEALKKAKPDATTFQIENLNITDENWMGNARGVYIWIDNFRFAPVVPKSFKANAVLRDLSGVGGVSYIFDQNPNSSVDEIAENGSDGPASIEIPENQRAAGLWYLHVRAKNKVGNWSETSHFPVFIAG